MGGWRQSGNTFVWQWSTDHAQIGTYDSTSINFPMGDYTNWDFHQPDNSGGNENCVMMWPNRGFMWNDAPGFKEYCFICEDRTLQ